MDILQTSKRLQNMQDNVSALETKKRVLEQDLRYKKTDRFVEEEARNRLNMIKKGEKVLVLPSLASKPQTNVSNVPKPVDNDVLGSSDTSSTDESNNFWQWIELFL